MRKLTKHIFILLIIAAVFVGCITIKASNTMHTPFFSYFLMVSEAAKPFRNPQNTMVYATEIGSYDYQTEEIHKYFQSSNNDYFLVEKYNDFYHADIENLKKVCTNCKENEYQETLQDGRQITYIVTQKEHTYTISARVK